ncbi:MAG: endonuclease III [bacterium]
MPKFQKSHKVDLLMDLLNELYGRKSLPKVLHNPLDSPIQTILSQNTNDKNSHRAWIALKKRFPSWYLADKADQRILARTIEVGGLKNQKALTIKKILRTVKANTGNYSLAYLKKYDDVSMFNYLLQFDGVGPKTAACVMIFAFGRSIFPVDTHIHRICKRVGIVNARTADETQRAMQPLVDPKSTYSFHINLIRFGRNICKAQKPKCGSCPIFDLCIFTQKYQVLSEKNTGR